MSVSFVHLRLHTEYSLSDSIIRIKPLTARLAELGMPACAITDQTNFYGLIKFYKAMQGQGIKPIAGSDFLIAGADSESKPTLITLLAMNDEGYKNIIALISRAYQQGQQQGIAYVQRSWIEEYTEGVIALSGGRLGEVGMSLLSGRKAQAADDLQYWMSQFPGRFYLELQRTGREYEESYLHSAIDLSARFQCPVVATNDVRFLKADDFEVHEARVCISEGRTLDDPRREKRYSEQQYLRSGEEMQELFSDIPEALQNSVEIAKRCTVNIHLGEYFLPQYPIPEGMTENDFFEKVCFDGLYDRLEWILDKNQADYQEQKALYEKRLRFELDIILQMGFPGYFLIVMDFIQWAKDNGIPVGPGRGSGAGSLVAYSLKITDLDPLQYDLLFERFLNPERVSMPDFDVDFCMENRDRVISYVADTYGREAVSQIITFGTMAAKAVVRDVARVLGKSYGLADKLSKLIPPTPGMTLKQALEEVDQLREMLDTDGDAQEIWEMAVKLEGLTRNVGKHAGGVVIAPNKLTDFSPLYCDESGKGLVTQYDKNDVEEAGLVKFDFLGLRTLTIIDWAMEMINAQRVKASQEPLDINAIDLQDGKTFALLKRAETTAVFQLESRGMKDLIKRLKPDNLEDMIALVALFRPGPLDSGMVTDFVNRKHGQAEVAYPDAKYQHKCLEPILKPTYGVIVYQEQVMQIAQELAGYSLGGADLLRRAMGKKKLEEMAKQREIFKEGAKGKGIDPDLAMKIFDLVEKFAGYGFNKSHSAAYALVSYQTAWLKAHYPAHFMAATMSSDMDKTDKVVTFIEECRTMGLTLLPPDVNRGELKFTVDDDNNVIYGLGAIKGLGEGPVESIISARNEGGPFQNLFDFCARIDPKKVNKRALEALIRSGAADNLGPGIELDKDRAVMFSAIGEAVKAAEQSAANASAGMVDLFGDVVPVATETEDAYREFSRVHAWSMKERLQAENDTLGLYLTGHPIDEYEHEIQHLVSCRISNLQPDKKAQRIGGLVVASRTMKTKRGDTMAFITLDDRTGRIEIAVFADTFTEFRELLVKDALLLVEGQVSHDDYNNSLKMRADSIKNLAEARQEKARALRLTLQGSGLSAGFNAQLKNCLEPYRDGVCPVVIDYQRSDARCELVLGSDWGVRPEDELLQRLRNEYGMDSVKLQYR
ncbi:DNA polymerase III subunit alpha [Gilvimarinus xylanilyticus]|uniref:DNA polymerase III subunit alpha n=1 Tax=Gilvimarinus xylanilyticus TaxID=2944139 RepID=A0A9X2I0W1_9GAMM|nr:DNA polymerase III subunit alpha [Gilvimarinus xylanilyticus]MCP8898598.1 DNA polymerase III subunit alpha [Gilvimarinus xylanilyticus]